jgi:hypothetical protein
MNTKYQFFISSTYEDLKKEREVVLRCVLEMGHVPVGMELFSAADEAQWDVIKRQIDECDYYLVLIAQKYGSMDGPISYTEKEYDYATSKGIPVLGFILDDSARWPTKYVEIETAKKQLLAEFKGKVRNKLVTFWYSSEDLYGKAAIAIGKAISTYPRPGYVRSSEIPNVEVISQISSLSSENQRLRKAIAELSERKDSDVIRERTQLVEVLQNNKRPVRVWFENKEDWSEPYEESLLSIFENISSYLIDESSMEAIAHGLALAVSHSTKLRELSPVPKNSLRNWLKDLYALDLVEPSTRKHSAADTSEYWTLTQSGRLLLKDLRRLKLYSGLAKEDSMGQEGDPTEQISSHS